MIHEAVGAPVGYRSVICAHPDFGLLVGAAAAFTFTVGDEPGIAFSGVPLDPGIVVLWIIHGQPFAFLPGRLCIIPSILSSGSPSYRGREQSSSRSTGVRDEGD